MKVVFHQDRRKMVEIVFYERPVEELSVRTHKVGLGAMEDLKTRLDEIQCYAEGKDLELVGEARQFLEGYEGEGDYNFMKRNPFLLKEFLTDYLDYADLSLQYISIC